MIVRSLGGILCALVVGSTLLHYRIVRALGSGGMGEVYAAEDTKLHRLVALKILPAAMASDPERLARFRREAQAIAALNHPHVVTIYSVEEAAGTHFLTMELVEGRTLAEVIPPHGLPLPELLKIAVPLTDAVSAAHAQGVVHRDLKPSNVMLGAGGRVKVLDFGLAKLRQDALGGISPALVSTERLTAPHHVFGTPAYMSPEQAEGQALDHRTDVFSLGIVLYEMATGRRPFYGRDTDQRHLVDRQRHAAVDHAVAAGAALRSRSDPAPLPRQGTVAPISNRARFEERARGFAGHSLGKRAAGSRLAVCAATLAHPRSIDRDSLVDWLCDREVGSHPASASARRRRERRASHVRTIDVGAGGRIISKPVA